MDLTVLPKYLLFFHHSTINLCFSHHPLIYKMPLISHLWHSYKFPIRHNTLQAIFHSQKANKKNRLEVLNHINCAKQQTPFLAFFLKTTATIWVAQQLQIGRKCQKLGFNFVYQELWKEKFVFWVSLKGMCKRAASGSEAIGCAVQGPDRSWKTRSCSELLNYLVAMADLWKRTPKTLHRLRPSSRDFCNSLLSHKKTLQSEECYEP